MYTTPYTWLEVSASAIARNITAYKKLQPDQSLAPVIKSNAYGHGIELVAHICQQHPDVAKICVISIAEALQLRACGITKPLIVLSIPLGDITSAILHDIELVLFNEEQLALYATLAEKCNKVIRVHIKCDTGLSRLGLAPDNAVRLYQKIQLYPWVSVVGIFTHFAESESSDQTFTLLQLQRFTTFKENIKKHTYLPPQEHVSCSAALTAQPYSRTSLMRCGIGIYGLWPSQENKVLAQKTYPEFTLHPALTWKTKILSLKTIPAQSFVGYDRTFYTESARTIATLPVGYWDGLDRELSNKGSVYIKGKKAPLIGRIAMNLCMVDITHIPEAQEHDEVTLLGAAPGITADDIATLCSTINYEIITRINPLLPRIVVE